MTGGRHLQSSGWLPRLAQDCSSSNSHLPGHLAVRAMSTCGGAGGVHRPHLPAQLGLRTLVVWLTDCDCAACGRKTRCLRARDPATKTGWCDACETADMASRRCLSVVDGEKLKVHCHFGDGFDQAACPCCVYAAQRTPSSRLRVLWWFVARSKVGRPNMAFL